MHSLVRLRNTSSFFFFLGSAAEDPELHCSDQVEASVGSLGGSDAREALTLGGVGSLGGSDAKEVPELKCTCHDNTRHALLSLSVSLSVFPCLSLSVSLCLSVFVLVPIVYALARGMHRAPGCQGIRRTWTTVREALCVH